MKRFKFRLQQVLNYRNAVRKDKERDLAIRNTELFSAEEELTGIMAAQDGCQMPATTLSMAELMLTGEYQIRLREELENQRVMVQQATEAVEAARNAYIEKAVEAEILETLKEKRLSAHKEEVHKAERKQLDEIVVQRHGMKKRSHG